MRMFGLHIADLIAIAVYLLVVGGVGFAASRKVKKAKDFIMPHRFGKFTMAMFAFGAGTHSDQAVSVASKSYTNGVSGIWYQWFWLFATPFYWLIAPVMRRFRAVTIADVFEARFDRRIAVLASVVGVLFMSLSIGVMLKGSGAIIEACTGGHLEANIAILVMTVLFLFYGMAGGLTAAIYTDLIQGVLTVVFSFLILPSVMGAIGGMDGLREQLSADQLSITMPGDISIFYIMVISFCGIIGIAVQPHILGVCSAGKTELDGRVGFVAGNLLKRICTVAWCLTGVAAIVYYAGGEDLEPDQIYGLVAYKFLPEIAPGLIGIFIAALLASVMSSCDAFMISGSGLFTNNIYKPLNPDQSPKHYLFVLRLASLLVVLIGIGIAFNLPNVLRGLEIMWQVPTILGISFWLGFFWKRFNSCGVWVTTIVAIAVWLLTEQSWGAELLGKASPAFLVADADTPTVSLPWRMLLFTVTGTAAGVIASLLSKATDPDKLANYYDLVHTPVLGEEDDAAAPCTLPKGITAKPHLCLPLPGGLHVPIPNALTIAGFILTSIIVVGMIYALSWLVRG